MEVSSAPESVFLGGDTFVRQDLVPDLSEQSDLAPGKDTSEFKFFALAMGVAVVLIVVGTYSIQFAGSDGAGVEDARTMVDHGIGLTKWVIAGYGATRGLPKFGQQIAKMASKPDKPAGGGA